MVIYVKDKNGSEVMLNPRHIVAVYKMVPDDDLWKILMTTGMTFLMTSDAIELIKKGLEAAIAPVVEELAAIRRQLYSIEVRMDKLIGMVGGLLTVVTPASELDSLRARLKTESDSLKQSLDERAHPTKET